MGTLSKKQPTKSFKSIDNKIVSEHDTTLPSKIRFFTHGVWGSKFYKNLFILEYDR